MRFNFKLQIELKNIYYTDLFEKIIRLHTLHIFLER